MSLKQLRDKKAKHLAAAKAIHDKAGDAAFTTEQQTAYDTEKAAIALLDAQISRAEELQEAERSMEPSNPPAAKDKDGIEITVGEDKSKVYGTMGEFLQDVAALGENKITPKMQYYAEKEQQILAAATGQNTTVLTDGGVLVRRDFSTQFLEAAEEMSELLPRCNRIPIGEGSDGLEAPYIKEDSRATGSRNGGVRVYRKAEADTVSSSKIKLEKIDIRLEDLMGVGYVTERLLQDAPSLEGYLKTEFANEFSFVIDDEIYRGVGAGTCLGILNAPALITVGAEVGQDADTVVFDNVLNMRVRLLARLRKNAVWFINQDLEPQLQKMHMVIGTGGVPVWLPAGGASGNPYDTLLGLPVIPLEQASAPGDVGDIMLANLSDYIAIEKGGLQTASSMHVRFLYDEMTFKFKVRINGQPKTRKALTPYKGSLTKSPYVALAAR